MADDCLDTSRPLLARADVRAKALGISRDRLILEAIEARIQVADQWPAEVVRMLTEPVDPDIAAAADELGEVVCKGCRRP